MEGVCQRGSLGPLTTLSVYNSNDSRQTDILGFGPLCAITRDAETGQCDIGKLVMCDLFTHLQLF